MEKPSVKKNFAYNMLYQLLAIIVPLITSPYIARVLGAEQIGIHSWTHSVVFYFMIFALLGVSNYGNRTIAAARISGDVSSAFCSIYACQLTSSAAMAALYVLYLIFFPVRYPLIAALQIFFILSNALDITWFFHGLEEFRITVLRSCAVRLAGLAGIFLFVRTADDLWKYTLIVSGTTFLGSVMLWPALLRRVRLSVPKPSQLLPHIKPILVLFIPVLAISIFVNMDKYMIGRLSDILQSGYYENTDKIIGIPKAVITALGTVMLPRTVSLIASGQEEKSRELMTGTIVYTVLAGSAFVAGMAAVADVFAVVYWGEEFAECGRLIAAMSPAILFSVFGNVIRTQYLIPRAKDREYTVSLVVGAAVNLCINLLLIPPLGAMGAVIGTVAAELAMTLMQWLYVRRELSLRRYVPEMLFFLLCGGVMFLTVRGVGRLLDNTVLSLVIMIAAGMVVYLVPAGLCIGFSKKEALVQIRQSLSSALRRLKGSRN